MARIRTVTIGAPGFEAVCPVPHDRIGLFEAVSLTVRGRIDARRNRGVPDTAHTHSLHRLMAAHRRREVEAGRRIDEALSSVDRALAPLEVILGAPPVVPESVPTSDELAGLPATARAEWAARVRAAHSANARAQQDAARRSGAETEAAVLRSIRDALDIEGADVLRQWREAYAMRAARYTRARFNRRGSALTDMPGVAIYVPVEPPTPRRRD